MSSDANIFGLPIVNVTKQWRKLVVVEVLSWRVVWVLITLKVLQEACGMDRLDLERLRPDLGTGTLLSILVPSNHIVRGSFYVEAGSSLVELPATRKLYFSSELVGSSKLIIRVCIVIGLRLDGIVGVGTCDVINCCKSLDYVPLRRLNFLSSE